jgi:RNA polymerase-binding transcription factor DksA
VTGGRYGVCVACGRPIAAERLEARPSADRCLRCAERTRP